MMKERIKKIFVITPLNRNRGNRFSKIFNHTSENMQLFDFNKVSRLSTKNPNCFTKQQLQKSTNSEHSLKAPRISSTRLNGYSEDFQSFATAFSAILRHFRFGSWLSKLSTFLKASNSVPSRAIYLRFDGYHLCADWSVSTARNVFQVAPWCCGSPYLVSPSDSARGLFYHAPAIHHAIISAVTVHSAQCLVSL